MTRKRRRRKLRRRPSGGRTDACQPPVFKLSVRELGLLFLPLRVARLLVVGGIVEGKERSWRKHKIHEQSGNPLSVWDRRKIKAVWFREAGLFFSGCSRGWVVTAGRRASGWSFIPIPVWC